MRTHDQIQQEIDDLLKATPWASHPRFPVSDWQYEVANDDTRQGYATWLYNMLSNDDGELSREYEDQKSWEVSPICEP